MNTLGDNIVDSMRIRGLAYSDTCSGTPVLDQSSTGEDVDDYIPVGIRNVYAQKFTPTSKCLSSVTLKIKKVADVGATIRICSDNNGYPDFPASNLGEYTKHYSELSFSYAEANFPLNIILPNISPVWIVITSNYDPNSLYTAEMIRAASLYVSSGNNFAGKVANNPWRYYTGKPVFKTFKQYIACTTPTPVCDFIVE